MQEFYFIMVWIIFAMITFCMVASLYYVFSHVKRHNKMIEVQEKLTDLEKNQGILQKKIDHNNELFEEHFKITDKTIIDLRNERDFWKHISEKSLDKK